MVIATRSQMDTDVRSIQMEISDMCATKYIDENLYE